jgi:MarR family transcriptional regulator, transcriptional regulator for hemolysin
MYITLRREVEDLLKHTGLTHTKWSALGIIRLFLGITSSEIEHILMIERPSVTSLMYGLTSKGLIIRKPHPEDARFKHIIITAEGKRLADEWLIWRRRFIFTKSLAIFSEL